MALLTTAPYGYTVQTWTEVTPKPPPVPAVRLRWRIGPVGPKSTVPIPSTYPHGRASSATESEITVQLTADQQVALSITGQDRYDNPVDISGDTVWSSSDDAIVTVVADPEDPSQAVATAVGPVGTAAVTVSNDVNADGTGDYQGSLAIDVVAGAIAEIVIVQGPVTDKPAG